MAIQILPNIAWHTGENYGTIGIKSAVLWPLVEGDCHGGGAGLVRSVFIISAQTVVCQRIRRAIEAMPTQYLLVGQTDSSVVGKSLIEELLPHIVLVHRQTQFLDAKHLIQDIQALHLPVQFIVLDPHSQRSEKPGGMVSGYLPEAGYSDAQLRAALDQAGQDWDRRYRDRQRDHQQEDISQLPQLSELTLGLHRGRVLTQFTDGLVQVSPYQSGGQVWLCLLSTGGRQPSFYAHYGRLTDFLIHIQTVLDLQGGGMANFLNEREIILLIQSGHTGRIPAWNTLNEQLSQLSEELGLPSLALDVLDVPIPMSQIHEGYLQLQALHKERFYLGEVGLLRQSDITPKRKRPSHEEIVADIQAIVQCVRSGTEAELDGTIERLFDHLKGAHSQQECAYAFSQLVFQYCRLVKVNQLSELEYVPVQLQSSPEYLWEHQAATRAVYLPLLRTIRAQHSPNSGIISQVITYLAGHLREAVTLEAVAKQVHLSPTYLSRFFKRETGRTFVSVLTELRMEKAKELLAQGWRIADIAPQVGYDNAKYFSQVFRQTVGLSPSKYGATLTGREGTP